MTILVVAFAVVIVTSAIHGAAGFGMNLLAVPVLIALNPQLVPGPAVALGLVLSGLVAVRERTPWDRDLGWAVVGLVPGTAGALLLLSLLPDASLSTLLGVAVLVAVLLSMVRLRLHPDRPTLFAAGVASGLLATAGSIGGPPLALVYANSPGGRIRSNLSMFFVLTAAVSLLALSVAGRFGAHELRLSLLLLPGVLLGYLASGPLRPWVDRGHAHAAILVLSALAGIGAIIEGVLVRG